MQKSWQFRQTSADQDRLTSSPLRRDESQAVAAQRHKADLGHAESRLDGGCTETVAGRDRDPLMNPRHIALVALGLLQIGDYLTTRIAFSYGAIESNPLVQVVGLWPAKLLALGIVGLLWWHSRSLARLSVLCGAYAGIVFSNMLTVWQASMRLR